jgi:hypothetical protein
MEPPEEALHETERDINGHEEKMEIDVFNYIHHNDETSWGHPFLARKRLDGDFEILGSNDVLAAARNQKIATLGTVILYEKTDAQWIMMSRFTKRLTIRRMLWFYTLEKETKLVSGMSTEDRVLAGRVIRLDNLGTWQRRDGTSNLMTTIKLLEDNPKSPVFLKMIADREAEYQAKLFINKNGEVERDYTCRP